MGWYLGERQKVRTPHSEGKRKKERKSKGVKAIAHCFP